MTGWQISALGKIEKINKAMPTYKHITKLVVTDQPMIKTTTGKVKRYEETKNM